MNVELKFSIKQNEKIGDYNQLNKYMFSLLTIAITLFCSLMVIMFVVSWFLSTLVDIPEEPTLIDRIAIKTSTPQRKIRNAFLNAIRSRYFRLISNALNRPPDPSPVRFLPHRAIYGPSLEISNSTVELIT